MLIDLNTSPNIFVFCALACEAKPLIKAWRLKKLPAADHPVAIYADQQRVVVITGVGKLAMAGAVGYVMAVFANPVLPILLNLGIAGHRTHEPGNLVLGHKIMDSESGRSFYPQLPFTVSVPTDSVFTQAKPNTDYPTEGVFDMEASGFYEMAVKFSSSELIQVVKIISDNAQSPVTEITEIAVEKWVDSQLSNILLLIDRIGDCHSPGPQNNMTQIQLTLSEQFHITVSQSLKLKALLQRWWLLKGDTELKWREAGSKNAKELLAWIENELDSVDFYL